MTTSHNGSCLCGSVRFTASGPLRGVIYCHCSQCRKQSGHYYAATSVDDDRLEIEVAVARRARGHPFEAVRAPRIASNCSPEKHTADEVVGEDHLGRDHANGADRHELIHRQQVLEVGVWI